MNNLYTHEVSISLSNIVKSISNNFEENDPMICYICCDNTDEELIESPCPCRANMHRSCLTAHIAHIGHRCTICRSFFIINNDTHVIVEYNISNEIYSVDTCTVYLFRIFILAIISGLYLMLYTKTELYVIVSYIITFTLFYIFTRMICVIDVNIF